MQEMQIGGGILDEYKKCKYIRGIIPLLRQYEDETYLPGSAHFMNYFKCIELQRQFPYQDTKIMGENVLCSFQLYFILF